jgi:hypothetical protein
VGGPLADSSPRPTSVHLYDIKWPSARSFFIQFLFICDEYQWAMAVRALAQESEDTLSLAAEQALSPFGERRTGKRVVATTALTLQVNFHPLPRSVVTLSDAPMAKIKG